MRWTGWRAGLVLAGLAGVSSAHAEPAAPAPAAGVGPAAVDPATPGPTASEDERSKTPVVSDGPVAVTTRLSPDPSNVGDLLVFEVVAAYPRDVRVNLPTRLSFDPLHHVRTEEGEPEPTGDGLRKTFRIELQHFEVGTAQIPSFPLTYVGADGGVHTVPLPARSFTVESLLVNEDDPQRRGEDPPVSREYPDTLAETILWSALGTLLLALVAWLVLRRLWGREREVVLPPPTPPHEVAFEALEQLEKGELIDQGRVQLYYVELTEIAKGYLQGRFGVPTLDRTTDEIRHALLRDGKRLEPLSADDVIEFLQSCDLVKFARAEPSRETSQEALEQVREMVESTVPSTSPSPPSSSLESKPADGDADPPKPPAPESAEATSPEAVPDQSPPSAGSTGEPRPAASDPVGDR